jgi:DMSO/TMAO reductase YedYZ molybdopterin-dependent catalytic subunit
MREQRNILAILLIAVALLGGVALSGCTTGSVSVSPTAAPTENPTVAATPAPTSTPTVTATAVPSVTPTNTPTATPTASQVYSIPPWVDHNSGNVTIVPAVMTTFTSVAPDGKYPYDGEVPPWVDYKIQVPQPVVVSVTGNVANPLGLTMYGLQNDYPIQHVHVTIKTKVVDADGASLNAILSAAKPKSGATQVKLISSDGYSATITLAEITADNNAVIAFTNDGLRVIIPSVLSGSSGTKYQVSNIANIQVL